MFSNIKLNIPVGEDEEVLVLFPSIYDRSGSFKSRTAAQFASEIL